MCICPSKVLSLSISDGGGVKYFVNNPIRASEPIAPIENLYRRPVQYKTMPIQFPDFIAEAKFTFPILYQSQLIKRIKNTIQSTNQYSLILCLNLLESAKTMPKIKHGYIIGSLQNGINCTMMIEIQIHSFLYFLNRNTK